MQPSGGGASPPLGPRPARVGSAPPPSIGDVWTVVSVAWNIHGEVEVLLVTSAPRGDPDRSPRLVWARVTALAAVDAEGRRRPLQFELRQWG